MRERAACPAESGIRLSFCCFSLARGIAALIAAALALPTAQAAAPRLARPVAPFAIVQQVAVFGRDDRRPVPPKYESVAQSIGLLFNNQTRTVCSAFCVGENIIATAAHCLANPSTGRPTRAADFSFARNYDRSRDLARVEGFATRSSSQNVVTGDFQLHVRPPIDAAHDWALMRLARPACAKRELTVRVLSTPELVEEAHATRVFQIAYHRDYRQWKPAYSTPCGIARDFANAAWTTIAPDFLEPDHMIMHTCDTGGASSGSPMLMDTPDGPVVVGINVGTYVQSKVVVQNGHMTHRQRAETVANTAVNAAAFAEKIELLRNAHILASGAPMRSLQERLRQHRYYSGRVDGTYGPALRAAIESYERANTLAVTGLATKGLLLRLSAERAMETAAPAAPNAATK